MNELQIFNYQNNQVRTVEKDGEPWFVAADVCKILEIGNNRDAVARLDDDEKNTVVLNDGIPGNPNKTIVSESGLYTLVLSSRKKEAKAFKRWITHDVVPSIRKHGAYAVDELLNDPDLAIKAFTALKDEREKNKNLELENARQKQIIGELQPKANYVDIILNNRALVTITQIAKDYGMSGRTMNKKLHELGVQYNQSGQWLLYRKYHAKGYTHSQTIDITRSDGYPDIVMETKWTQKGRLFLYELLKDNGIIPIIERDIKKGA